MPLHPNLVAVVTGLDADEQDVVERLCRGDWDRVTIDPDTGRISIDGRLTVFAIEPEEDDDKYFLQPGSYVVAPGWPSLESVLEEGATFPNGPFTLPHVMHPDTKRCVHCDTPMQQMDRGKTCPSAPKLPVEARDSTPDAQTGGLAPVTPASTGDDRRRSVLTVSSAVKECGYVECSDPAEPGKKYCSVRCQRRQANHVRKLTGDRAKAAATPVLEPVPEIVPAEDAVPLAEWVEAPAPRRVWCVRCEKEGHFVEECPTPMTRRKKPVADLPVQPALSTPVDPPVEDASQASVREAKTRLAAQKANRAAGGGEGPRVITCARCQEKGHSVFTCTKSIDRPKPVIVQPLSGESVTDDDLTAHSQRLLELCRGGLPDRFQYSFLPDVLALYGVDQQLLDGALRGPDRVEIRPESFEKDKRYCVLAFYRGDIEVILGMRQPATPKVIAVYAASRLEHDTHRVGHTGGGGSRSSGVSGLPKSARQVAHKLRALGGRELEVELSITEDFVPVTYKGQELGKIATNGDRKTSEQDFQRIQRKMAAIDRRASVG